MKIHGEHTLSVEPVSTGAQLKQMRPLVVHRIAIDWDQLPRLIDALTRIHNERQRLLHRGQLPTRPEAHTEDPSDEISTDGR